MWYLSGMNPENILAGTASLFMALGDKTRLRLLNLMRDREICVSSLTGTLGHSQPLVSRHLAYLRNSGIVEARREGKWMHYSLSKSLDENTARLLSELFRWMETQEGLRIDRAKYRESHGLPKELETGEREAPILPPTSVSATKKRPPAERPLRIPERKVEVVEVPYEDRYDPPARHNELEDFLL
jgi:ArsR family transcriptional regulator